MKINKYLYWTPRVLAILFLLFLAMFSLDIFDGASGFWQIVVGLLMHNFPVFILAFFLAIGWKREWIPAVIFIGAGLLYIAVTLTRVAWYMALSWSLTIAGPAFLVGILFWINWARRKKSR